MNSNAVFEIKDFTTSYNGNVKIYIPELEIFKGEIVVILGNSGCGKTTLFETLGLMKRYYENESKVKVNINSEFSDLSYKDIWSDKEKIIEIRRKHYSFLFQDSIFFNNLKTIKENVILPKLLQPENLNSDEVEFENIKEKVNEIFNDNITLENKVNTLSGGEKQRVGFIRANYPEHHVFFADEPTGNLGENDAKKVFSLIANNIRKNQNVTALIVTHSIGLAREFADRIIVMNSSGTVKSENVLKTEKMKNDVRIYNNQNTVFSDEDILDLMNESDNNKIIDDKNALIKNIPLKHRKPLQKNYLKIVADSLVDIMRSFSKEKSRFVRYLIRPETNEKDFLFTKGNFLLWILLFIYISAFSGIFYSGRSLDTLDEKMNDPFLLWTDLKLKNEENINTITDSLNSNSDDFNILGVDTWAKTFDYFVINDDDTLISKYAVGQTIDASSSKLQKLMDEKIIYRGRVFNDNNDLGIIVSDKFLRKLGYVSKHGKVLKVDYVYLKVTMDEDLKDVRSKRIPREIKFPIKVIGQAKILPNKSSFLCSKKLLYGLKKQIHKKDIMENKHFYMLSDSNLDKNQLESFFSEEFPGNECYVVKVECAHSKLDTLTKSNDYSYTFKNMKTMITYKDFDKFLKNISIKFKNSKIMKYYPFEVPNITKKQEEKFNRDHFTGVSINVINVDKMEKLAHYLADNFQEEMDMEYVENIDNYNIVAKITQVLITTIVLLSILFSTIFIFQLLYFDLYKSRKYIGYLLAIGASENQVSLVYIRKTTVFLILVIIISFFVSLGLYTLYLLCINSFSLHYYMILLPPLSWNPMILILLSIIFSFIGRRFALEKILLNEPSELIYDRIDNN
ncbi:MAG: ATP-binding cassette domain-containing protein [Candidatus Delongbacteria bacterium]|nr:ATP-binding cassette domain-containing protein [Candidatus Delongbacteria bacterium]